jgi:sugar/nucleoside kinase (ribokinase family)
MYEVYCYGMITPSTVHLLDAKFSFPSPNQYAEIGKSFPSVGGEAVNTAIMLSKLGYRTKLDGNWLSEKNAPKVMDLLKPYGIDTSRLTVKADCGTEEIVITDKYSRTVFGNYAAFHTGEKQWNTPVESDIMESKMIALDPYFKDDALMAAKMCVKNCKRYVTLDSRYDDFIAVNSEAVVISHELRDQAYRDCDMKDLFEKYLQTCKGLVIFTFGSDDLWYARKGQELKKYKPYKITPVDTTGAGDSFRSGIIYGLLNGLSDYDTMDFASAVAACVCLTIPHALNAPGLEGVRMFMAEHKK